MKSYYEQKIKLLEEELLMVLDNKYKKNTDNLI